MSEAAATHQSTSGPQPSPCVSMMAQPAVGRMHGRRRRVEEARKRNPHIAVYALPWGFPYVYDRNRTGTPGFNRRYMIIGRPVPYPRASMHVVCVLGVGVTGRGVRGCCMHG